jgi:hypothetical protein
LQQPNKAIKQGCDMSGQNSFPFFLKKKFTLKNSFYPIILGSGSGSGSGMFILIIFGIAAMAYYDT